MGAFIGRKIGASSPIHGMYLLDCQMGISTSLYDYLLPKWLAILCEYPRSGPIVYAP